MNPLPSDRRRSRLMQPLGRNKTGYAGETIQIGAALREFRALAAQQGWHLETISRAGGPELLACSLRRPDRPPRKNIYLSAGIHGDEPASPLAMLELFRENHWPETADFWVCPCLNPTGFPLNRRENAQDQDLNRDYRHLRAAEVQAHVDWLSRQPRFDLALHLHEDWEAQGFYVYELNPDDQPSLAEPMVAGVASVCPIDHSPVIEDRPARGGIIRPRLNPRRRPEWPEAFYMIQNKTRLSYTLEAPSDFALPVRVQALTTAVRVALNHSCGCPL